MAETFGDRIIEKVESNFKKIAHAVFGPNIPENPNSRPRNINQRSAKEIEDNFNEALGYKKKV